MANAADPLMAGPERRVFIAAAVGTVVLDLITKVIAIPESQFHLNLPR